jgi:hypothetical protein
VDRVLDDQRAQCVVTFSADELQDEWMILGMLAASPPAAEPAGRKRRSLANPAIH